MENLHKKIKQIIASEFEVESTKDRGFLTNEVGNTLQSLEIEIQKKINELFKTQNNEK